MLVYFKDQDRTCKVVAIGEMYRHNPNGVYMPSLRYSVVQMVQPQHPTYPPIVMSLFEFLKTARRKDNKNFRLREGPASFWELDDDNIEVTFLGFTKTASNYTGFIVNTFSSQREELSLEDLNDFHIIIEE